jgi:hypothetical protein
MGPTTPLIVALRTNVTPPGLFIRGSGSDGPIARCQPIKSQPPQGWDRVWDERAVATRAGGTS